MCANFEPITKAQAKLFTSRQLSFDFKADIYPNYDTPLLFASKEDQADDPLQWRCVRFGMIPKWADDTDITRFTYNARSETVHEKPSFRHAWYNSQFALIPVQTIFEPKYIEGKAERWGIRRKDEQPFTVAAIYEVAKIQGEIIRSMSMLTINADDHPFMSQFHKPNSEKRSIVVIPEDKRRQWLTCQHNQAHKFLMPMSDAFYAEPKPRRSHSSHNSTTNKSSQQNTLF